MICYVHGAFSSDRSFNYIRMNLPEHERVAFEYDVRRPLEQNLQDLSNLLVKQPVQGIVGHSLGGVMAALMIKRGIVGRGVSIAAPLGGFNLAVFMPFTQLLVDVASTRPIFEELKSHDFGDSLLNITASRNKWTDGVVPIGSQTAIQTNIVKYIEANHFEVMLDQTVSEHIADYFALRTSG